MSKSTRLGELPEIWSKHRSFVLAQQALQRADRPNWDRGGTAGSGRQHRRKFRADTSHCGILGEFFNCGHDARRAVGLVRVKRGDATVANSGTPLDHKQTEKVLASATLTRAYLCTQFLRRGS
jgi:hypothetical protein